MYVPCPICEALHELTDANLPGGFKQAACQECGANLVLLNAQSASGNTLAKRIVKGSAPAKQHNSRASGPTRLWGIVAVAILCVINYSLLGSAVFGLHYSIKNSEAYKASESFLRENEQIKQVIGDDIQFGFLPSGKMQSNDNLSTAEFNISIKGSYRSTVAWVALVKHQNNWRVIKASYKDASGTFQPLVGHESTLQVEQPAPKPVEPRLTQEDILIVLAAYDKAVNERNVEGILAHMADNMTFKASVHLASELKTFQFTRSEYQTYLRQNYVTVTTYQFQRTGTTISIAPDGSHAKALFQMFEHSTFESGEWRFKGTEVMHFELRGGRPVITRVELAGGTEKV